MPVTMMSSECQETIHRLTTRILELCPRIVDLELRSELERLAAGVIAECRNATALNSELIAGNEQHDDFEENENGVFTSLRHRF